MTNEDYRKWLLGMIAHNIAMSIDTEGEEREIYRASAVAYEKACTVFENDVMRRRNNNIETKEAKERQSL